MESFLLFCSWFQPKQINYKLPANSAATLRIWGQLSVSHSSCHLLVQYYFQVSFCLYSGLLFCNPSLTRLQVWLRHPCTSAEVTIVFRLHASSLVVGRCLQKTLLPPLKSTEHNVTALFTQIALLLWDMFFPAERPALRLPRPGSHLK